MDIPVKTMRITLRTMMESLFDAFFPEYSPNSYEYSVNEAVKALSSLCGPEKADLFRERIPVLAELLAQDVEAIGEGSVIGGNVWLTHSVPPYSKILQGRTHEEFLDGAGI